jgi:hypothetical protein
MSIGALAVAPEVDAPVTTPYEPIVIEPAAVASPFTVVCVTVISPFAQIEVLSAIAKEYGPISES